MDDDVFLWGEELTLDQFVVKCSSPDVDYVEWFMQDDRLRLFTKGGEKFNYRNEKSRLDIVSVLEKNGLKIGDGGLDLHFED